MKMTIVTMTIVTICLTDKGRKKESDIVIVVIVTIVILHFSTVRRGSRRGHVMNEKKEIPSPEGEGNRGRQAVICQDFVCASVIC